jgi:hypothetical protein
MSFQDSDFSDPRSRALARIAALQRLREQINKENREAMVRSIDQLIEQETRSLRERDGDSEPQR